MSEIYIESLASKTLCDPEDRHSLQYNGTHQWGNCNNKSLNKRHTWTFYLTLSSQGLHIICSIITSN